jgi:release factor glutamine methyltransferase
MTDAAGGPDSVAALLMRAARRLADAGIPAAEASTEARLLMQHALAVSPEQLRLRHPDRSVGDDEVRRYDALVERRRGREPLAYITGSREFYGLALRVTPAVLIPRPETEFVVEAVLRHVAPLRPQARVADVGTGSGCIAGRRGRPCAAAPPSSPPTSRRTRSRSPVRTPPRTASEPG